MARIIWGKLVIIWGKFVGGGNLGYLGSFWGGIGQFWGGLKAFLGSQRSRVPPPLQDSGCPPRFGGFWGVVMGTRRGIWILTTSSAASCASMPCSVRDPQILRGGKIPKSEGEIQKSEEKSQNLGGNRKSGGAKSRNLAGKSQNREVNPEIGGQIPKSGGGGSQNWWGNSEIGGKNPKIVVGGNLKLEGKSRNLG